jgi:hypothetical protein
MVSIFRRERSELLKGHLPLSRSVVFAVFAEGYMHSHSKLKKKG